MNGITMDQWMKIVPDSVVNLPEGLRNLLFQLYQTFIAADRWKWFLNGLKITFAVTIGALILGVIIGLLIAVVRTAHDSRRMGKSNIIPVSYTHLDVYKRQTLERPTVRSCLSAKL